MTTILVVDDMAIYREPIEVVLRARGYRVIGASNGMEALAALNAHRPDLMLLDLAMPHMDGMAVLREMRAGAQAHRVAVIIMSADSERSHVMEAIKLGIDGYIIKSHFSLKAMLERVEKALATRAAPGAHAATGLRADPVARPGPTTDHTPRAATGSMSAIPHIAQEVRVPIADLRPLMTRTETMKRVATDEELEGLSPTISQVLRLTASDRYSMDEVSKAVSQDQAIALKLLKLANSPVYSRGDRVDTVHKAVLRIGVASIRMAVLNIGVVERFGSIAFEHHLNTLLFWEHSIACGLVAATLARELQHKESDSAFTAGLLHDLGRVILAERLGAEYVSVLDAARDGQVPVDIAEKRLLMVTHAEVMGKLLLSWRFPKELVGPVVCHHAAPEDVRTLAPHQSQEVLRIGLADRLVHAIMLGSSGNEVVYPTETHCRLLGVRAETIDAIVQTARQQTDDTRLALLSGLHGAQSHRPSDRYRADLGGPFRPLYISSAPEFDAYRIFCGELAGPRGTEPFHIAVVHIASAKDRAALSQKLVAAEQESGVGALPTIILSPDGRSTLDEAVLAGRALRMLATPTPIPVFVGAVQSLRASPGARNAA